MQEGKKLPMSIRSVFPLLPLCILSACAANTDAGSPSESTGVTAQAELGANQGNDDHQGNDNQRVLLISVDGMHQSDLDWYVTVPEWTPRAAPAVGRALAHGNAARSVVLEALGFGDGAGGVDRSGGGAPRGEAADADVVALAFAA